MYTELGWKPLQQRRDAHKTCKIFDIVKGHSPDYLRRNLPRRSGGRGTRSTAAENFVLYYCRTETLINSFYPTGINLFNNLDNESRRLNRNSFKAKMKRTLKLPVPLQYYTGPRQENIAMCQMRLKFSILNADLYNKGCIDRPICSCGDAIETLHHYFYECKRYTGHRFKLLDAINSTLVGDAATQHYSAEILICGSNELNEELNTSLYNAAIIYVSDTQRFSN